MEEFEDRDDLEEFEDRDDPDLKPEHRDEKLEMEQFEDFEESVLKEAPRKSVKDVKWFIKRLQTDVQFFFDFFYNMGMSRKQLDIANSWKNNRRTVAITSRQVGKSTIGGGTSGNKLIFERDVSLGIYAPSFHQAINVGFGYVRAFLENQPVLFRQVNEVKKSGLIVMNNGNKCMAQTANKESNIRGFSPSDIWIDESAFIDDETYYSDILGSGAAVKGLKMRGGKARYTTVLETTTPYGRNHLFKSVRPIPEIEMAEISAPNIIKHRPERNIENITTIGDTNVIYCPWWESNLMHDPDQYIIDLGWVYQQFENNPRRWFEQEYCCSFNTDEGFAFKINHVYAQCNITDRNPIRSNKIVYCAGIDFGRSQDHTVLTVLKIDPRSHVRSMVFHYEWGIGDDWNDIYRESLDMLHYWRPGMTLMDITGIGEPIFESVYKRQSKLLCKGWIYGNKSKQEIMRRMQRHLEVGTLILWDDTELIRQLKDTKEKLIESGMVKYPKPDDGHDDRVQATALALQACAIFMGDDDGKRSSISGVPMRSDYKAFNEWLENEMTTDFNVDWTKGSPSAKKAKARVAHSTGRRRQDFKELFDY